jgi:hypothetical protein
MSAANDCNHFSNMHNNNHDIESGLYVEHYAWVDEKLREISYPQLLPLCPCPITWAHNRGEQEPLELNESILKKRLFSEMDESVEENLEYLFDPKPVYGAEYFVNELPSIETLSISEFCDKV